MRTKLLSLCLTATMLLPCIAFSACNSGGDPNISETGEVTLRFWNGFTGMDGDSMDAIVADFNEEYAGEIKVVTDKMDWDTLFTKLTTTKSNLSTAPHVVAMSNQRLAGIVDQDLLMAIDDLPDYLGVTESDYISSAWNAGVIDGTRYSFPLDIHPTAMFYNKDLISEDELPTTWEEFVEICIEKTDPETGVYGFAVPSMYSITKDIFASILLQNGGALFDAENNAVYNSDQGDAALEFLSDLVYEYKVSPENVGAGGVYVGEWVNGVRDDTNGTYYFENGAEWLKFVGTFSASENNGWIWGEGTMYYADGRVVEGVFHGTDLVEETSVTYTVPEETDPVSVLMENPLAAYVLGQL